MSSVGAGDVLRRRCSTTRIPLVGALIAIPVAVAVVGTLTPRTPCDRFSTASWPPRRGWKPGRPASRKVTPVPATRRPRLSTGHDVHT